MNDVFIFAIGYNCGKVLNKCLESFHKFHNHKIHIFGTYKDFKSIDRHKNNEYIELSEDNNLKNFFKNGHVGTSYVWTKILKKEFGNYSKIIQIDSDVIFLEECISDILNKFNEGYDLIGARRAYKSLKTIPSNISEQEIRKLEDVVCTFFTGVNIEKISNYDFNTLHHMIAGYYNPLGHMILDFFDPVSFDILNNNGKIYYLNFNDYGSCNELGDFDNGYLNLNTPFDCGRKLIHFAGIGSGMNFYINGSGNVPLTYVNWAIPRYSLYTKLFYNEDIEIKYNEDDYNIIKKFLKI